MCYFVGYFRNWKEKGSVHWSLYLGGGVGEFSVCYLAYPKISLPPHRDVNLEYTSLMSLR